MKRPNLSIIGIEEENSQNKNRAQDLNNILQEIFPKLKQEIPIQVLEAHRTPSRYYQKRNSPHHIIVKTLDVQSKERLLRAAKEKQQIT